MELKFSDYEKHILIRLLSEEDNEVIGNGV